MFFYNSCRESHFRMQTQSVFSEGMRIWIPGHSQEWEMKGSWLPAALEKGFSIITLCCKGRIICICFIWKWAFSLWTRYCWAPSYHPFAFPPQWLRGEIKPLEERELFKGAFTGQRKDDQMGCHPRKYKSSPKSHPRTLPSIMPVEDFCLFFKEGDHI